MIIRSQKGELLTASDFHGFADLERGGPLLYNRAYPIHEEYALWLVYLASGVRCDIAQGNADNQITDFVSAP